MDGTAAAGQKPRPRGSGLMRKLSVLALASGLAATPAFAQPPAPGHGFHVEAITGYDGLGVEGKTADGAIYGLAVGYDFRVGAVTAGVEAEATDSTVDQCFGRIGLYDKWPCLGGGRDLYVGSRIGVVVGGDVLVYAKAGYANGRVNPGDTVSAAIFPPTVSSRNLDGIRAGAGLEIGLGRRLFVKTEYRYTNYEDGFDRHQLVGGVGLRF